MKKLFYIILLCCAVQAAFSQEPEKKDSIPVAMRQPGHTSKQKDKVKHQSGDTKVKDTKNCCCEEEESDCTEMTCSLRKQGLAKDLVYDFKSKDIKLPDDWRKLKKGDWLRLKVMNYNPYLYKLVIDHKDSSVAAVNDGKLLGWFFDPANLGSIVANIKGVPALSIPPIAKEILKQSAAENKNNQYLLTVKRNDFLKAFPRIPFAAFDNERIEFGTQLTVQEILDKQTGKTETHETQLKAKSKQIDDKLYAISRKFAILRTLIPDDCKSFERLKDNIKVDIEDPIKQFRTDLSQMDVNAAGDFKNYQAAIAPHMKIVLETPMLRVKDSLVKQFYKAFAVSIFKADSSINNKNMGDIIARLETTALLRSCYTSFPMQVTDDIKKISIEFKPRFDSLGLPAYNSQLLLPLIQPKIWGVSSGINISGLHNEAYVNKTIPKVQTGADSVYVLTADGQGNAQMGINALAYVGRKFNMNNDKPNYWGISFGAGMTIESKPKPRVLLGGSYITGEKNRVLFTLGFVGGPVSKLSNGYEVGAPYTKPATDFLKDVLGVSGFFSINYSFLSK